MAISQLRLAVEMKLICTGDFFGIIPDRPIINYSRLFGQRFPLEDARALIASTYMKQKLPFVLLRALGDMKRPKSPNVEIPHPSRWSIEFSLEVDLALDVIARMFHNQGCGFSDSSDYYLIGFNSFHRLGCDAIYRDE